MLSIDNSLDSIHIVQTSPTPFRLDIHNLAVTLYDKQTWTPQTQSTWKIQLQLKYHRHILSCRHSPDIEQSKHHTQSNNHTQRRHKQNWQYMKYAFLLLKFLPVPKSTLPVQMWGGWVTFIAVQWKTHQWLTCEAVRANAVVHCRSIHSAEINTDRAIRTGILDAGVVEDVTDGTDPAGRTLALGRAVRTLHTQTYKHTGKYHWTTSNHHLGLCMGYNTLFGFNLFYISTLSNYTMYRSWSTTCRYWWHVNCIYFFNFSYF